MTGNFAGSTSASSPRSRCSCASESAGSFVFRKRIITPAVISFVATAALLVWRWRIPAGDEEDVFRLLPTIPEKLHRIGLAIAAFPRRMLLLPRWGILWIA